MRVYQVGGSIRDAILNRRNSDIDYVIVGGDHEVMIKAGYTQVGKDFPVYLDEFGVEHAFARTERKTGTGYTGFSVNTENVTLVDDLARRDLTINAIARRDHVHDLDDGSPGEELSLPFVDPFNGIRDIHNRVLRHVTPEGFVEDPVRVLRVARFLAKFPDFSVHESTTKLISQMVSDGMLDELVWDRVNLELKKALMSESPSRFFYYLQMVGALEKLFPEIHALIGKTQPAFHHPEGDAFVHTMHVLELSTESEQLIDRWAALVHDLGKGTSRIDQLPKHHGHEDRGVEIVKSMVKRLRLPNEFALVGAFVAKYHTHVHKAMELRPSTIAKIASTVGGRDPNIVKTLCFVSKCDARGRGPFYEHSRYPQGELMENAINRAAAVRLSKLLTPEEIEKTSIDKRKQLILREQINVITPIQTRYKEHYR